jgi:hypothetical protein
MSMLHQPKRPGLQIGPFLFPIIFIYLPNSRIILKVIKMDRFSILLKKDPPPPTLKPKIQRIGFGDDVMPVPRIAQSQLGGVTGPNGMPHRGFTGIMGNGCGTGIFGVTGAQGITGFSVQGPTGASQHRLDRAEEYRNHRVSTDSLQNQGYTGGQPPQGFSGGQFSPQAPTALVGTGSDSTVLYDSTRYPTTITRMQTQHLDPHCRAIKQTTGPRETSEDRFWKTSFSLKTIIQKIKSFIIKSFPVLESMSTKG